MLHLPSVPLSVLLWLLAAGMHTVHTRHHRLFILFCLHSVPDSPCAIPILDFKLVPCSLCTTLPTWPCTTSASPRSPSYSTAWLSSMSPWRHWRGIRPCIGKMKPPKSRRRDVCDAPVAFTQRLWSPVDWHQGHSKELPPPLACLHVLDMPGCVRCRHLLLWCLLSLRQHHFHQQWPGECVGELSSTAQLWTCAVCLMCPLGYSNECFLKNTHPHNEFVFMFTESGQWHATFLLMRKLSKWKMNWSIGIRFSLKHYSQYLSQYQCIIFVLWKREKHKAAPCRQL